MGAPANGEYVTARELREALAACNDDARIRVTGRLAEDGTVTEIVRVSADSALLWFDGED